MKENSQAEGVRIQEIEEESVPLELDIFKILLTINQHETIAKKCMSDHLDVGTR